MAPFWDPMEGDETRPPEKRTKTDETKIAWLATQVNPTLTTLKEHGKLPLAIRALFGAHLAEDTVAAIVALLDGDDSR